MQAGRDGTPRLEEPGVLLVDAQPGFLMRFGRIEPPVAVARRWEKLLLICRHLRLPTLATFEEPEANGWLSEACERLWPDHGRRSVKKTYDCCGDQATLAEIEAMGVRQLLVAGTETDVCVLQSVLSLLKRGFDVFLLEDCVASTERHTRPALNRMYSSGAIPCTLKTAYYELMKSVEPAYRPESASLEWGGLVADFGSAEALPPWEPAK